MDVYLPLFVGFPLLFVAVVTVAPWAWLRGALSLLVPLGTALGGLWLFGATAGHTVLSHSVGLYIGGVAIPFVADQLAALMIVATSLMAVAANWFAMVVGETRSRFYPALSLMLLTGVMGALLTGDLFNFFVFIEVMLLPSYGLMAMTGTWARLSAGRSFVLVNLATSTLLLIGVAFVYGVTGTVNIATLQGAAAGGGPATIAMGIVVIAIIVKAGLFPVHTWLPRTYPSTSAAVMGLFSGLHTKVAVYMLLRVYVVIFDLDDRWLWLIVGISAISMIVGSFAGLAENSMRRILAYQMVSGMPFIVAMLAVAQGGAQVALAAGIFYMLHHIVTVGSLILTSGAVEETYGTDLVKKLSGIARRDKLVAAVFAAGAFSVVGFPPFSGLWGKYLIVMATAGAGHWLLLAVMLVASFGAFLAILRLWRKVYWGAPMNPERFPEAMRIPLRAIAPGAALMVVSLVMFLVAGPLVQATLDAAGGLLNTATYTDAVLAGKE